MEMSTFQVVTSLEPASPEVKLPLLSEKMGIHVEMIITNKHPYLESKEEIHGEKDKNLGTTLRLILYWILYCDEVTEWWDCQKWWDSWKHEILAFEADNTKS